MTAPDDDCRLDLLLADAEERRPVLDEGLPVEAAQRGPRPKDKDSFDRRRTDADPNDLALQRWAVVAPKGREGDQLLEAIAPLIRLREAEQGAPATIHRVPPDMDARDAAAWRESVCWRDDVPEDEWPHYLLLLGDLHHISLEFQHTLATGALVGRVQFEGAAGEIDLDGYAAYAEKVARYAREGSTPEPSPDMLFFAARDGSTATHAGEAKLVGPSLAAVQEGMDRGRFAVASARGIDAETTDELLAAGASGRPSVLLSVSHGLGPPRRGFRSEEEQQRRQGALLLGRGEVLDAERMRGQRFLPGGLWFCLACFGAGTPSTSAYHAWLAQLAKEGAYGGKAERVLQSLPAPGHRPFVAAMPQAALANPEGPLAVIGHMDLAWTYSFSSASNPSESRKSRILSALQAMARGGRAGVALGTLLQSYGEVNDALMASYQLQASARAEGRPDPTDRVDRAHLWMLRNDLRGYVLLGDPAARLPLRQNALRGVPPGRPGALAPPPRGEAPAAAAGLAQPGGIGDEPGGAGDVPIDMKVAAVDALFGGDEAPRAIAARAGVSLATLWGWVDAYRAGGRSRLGG
ncbi:hypothetical protein SOCE26_097360 [Sorangium cellulosum]|uniref:CHAT domain-containing protein n=1 Tax=Sorangium cellulosum TaxID=56 RepID=A0A2L0F9E2_SORCE|nr:hypothetical protein [Sorangium cellulosum]AUX48205.1 hypothetical protein SOCE26_097360 [Sorangium cellulosum]